MILSRVKPALQMENSTEKPLKKYNSKDTIISHFDDYLLKRDYAGAITLLEYGCNMNYEDDTNLWIAYCHFHRGDFKNALNIYETFYKQNSNIEHLALNIACCYFYLGMYDRSNEILHEASKSPLATRLNFHIAFKLKDEANLVLYHQQLTDTLEDQLSLAAVHYLRAHYQEAVQIYKRLLLNNLDAVALNIYVALCYYKMDYYDVSLEVVGHYMAKHPDSLTAINLKACNTFRLYNGAIAESELLSIADQLAKIGLGYDLLKHNMVVFRDGEDALQVLPPLVDVIPEARLNLVIHYLRNDSPKEAFELLSQIQPAAPQEYILKAIVNVTLGQEINSEEHIKTAEECFRLVGGSSSECDTINGRQCMAAVHFLLGQFEEVLVYLTTIKSYLHDDDIFNFNYAQAKVACNQFKEAEESLLTIQSPKIQNEYTYILTLARCYVMNKKPQAAWELYYRLGKSPESFNLLLQIANDCYIMGEFWYAAKAFDVLDKVDPNPEFWEGIRGAVVGVFQKMVAKKLSADMLGDVLQILRSRSSSQAEHIAKVMRKWFKEQQITT